MNQNLEFLSNEWLEYIIKSDSIVSTHGFKEICQNALDARKENKQLYEALDDMISLIDEYGDNILKAHTSRVWEARKILNGDFEL
jgi:hypothetical protein